MKEPELVIGVVFAFLLVIGFAFFGGAFAQIDHRTAYAPVIDYVSQIKSGQIVVNWSQPLLPEDDQTPGYRVIGSLNNPHITSEGLNFIDPYYTTFEEIPYTVYYPSDFNGEPFVIGQVYCYNVDSIFTDSIIVEGYTVQHSIGECYTYAEIAPPNPNDPDPVISSIVCQPSETELYPCTIKWMVLDTPIKTWLYIDNNSIGFTNGELEYSGSFTLGTCFMVQVQTEGAPFFTVRQSDKVCFDTEPISEPPISNIELQVILSSLTALEQRVDDLENRSDEQEHFTDWVDVLLQGLYDLLGVRYG